MQYFNVWSWRPERLRIIMLVIAGIMLSWTSGCSQNELVDEHNPYYIKGIKYRRQSEYIKAAEAFEKCLRLSPQSAEAHLQLGMIYEDHLHRPVTALYHYQSYVRKNPSGTNAEVAGQSVARLEQKLGGEWAALYGVAPTDEVDRRVQALEEENYKLKRQKIFLLKKLRNTNARLVEARKSLESTDDSDERESVSTSEQEHSPTRHDESDRVEKYVVRENDTLFSIARRKYGHGTLWHELLDYNEEVLAGRTELRVGEVLRIPQKEKLNGQ